VVSTQSFIHKSSVGNGHNPGTTIKCLESFAPWCKKRQAGSLCYFTPLRLQDGCAEAPESNDSIGFQPVSEAEFHASAYPTNPSPSAIPTC
jgi:hypothetical protein